MPTPLGAAGTSPRQLVGYLGLHPKLRQSGSTPARHGRTSKEGSAAARHVLGGDARARADGDVGLDFRPRSNDNALFKRRVTLGSIQMCPAQSHALINDDVVFNDRGFADDRSHSMVDDQIGADGRARMNVYSSQKPTELRYASRKKRYIRSVQCIRQAMQRERFDAWIKQSDL
jgi:hypothetical protein